MRVVALLGSMFDSCYGRKESLKKLEMLAYCPNMNAAEIIDKIQRLPGDEQGKVVEFVRHLPNAETIAAIHEPLEEGRSFKSAAELFAAIDEEG